MDNKILVENTRQLNNCNYSRFMSYASKLRKENKLTEAKKIHDNAQYLNKLFYSSNHTDNTDMILYYTNQMELVIEQTSKFIAKIQGGKGND